MTNPNENSRMKTAQEWFETWNNSEVFELSEIDLIIAIQQDALASRSDVDLRKLADDITDIVIGWAQTNVHEVGGVDEIGIYDCVVECSNDDDLMEEIHAALLKAQKGE